jgi:hypothetical protein
LQQAIGQSVSPYPEHDCFNSKELLDRSACRYRDVISHEKYAFTWRYYSVFRISIEISLSLKNKSTSSNPSSFSDWLSSSCKKSSARDYRLRSSTGVSASNTSCFSFNFLLFAASPLIHLHLKKGWVAAAIKVAFIIKHLLKSGKCKLLSFKYPFLNISINHLSSILWRQAWQTKSRFFFLNTFLPHCGKGLFFPKEKIR